MDSILLTDNLEWIATQARRTLETELVEAFNMLP